MKLFYFLLIGLVGLLNIPTINASTDSLQVLLDTLSDEKQRMEVMMQLGMQLKEDSPNQALVYYNSALILAEKQVNDSLAFQIHIRIGKLFEAEGKNNKAVTAYRKAAEIADNTNNSILQSIAYLHVGDTYSMLQKFDIAIIYFIKAKRIFENQNSQKQLGQTLKKIGESYQAQNRIDAAIQYNLLALDALASSKASEHFAETLENLGTLYFDNSEYTKSASYYNRSVRLFEQLKAEVDYGYLYQQLGEAQKLIGEHEAAGKSFKAAEEYAHLEQEKDAEVLKFKALEKKDADSISKSTAIDTVCEEDSIGIGEETYTGSDSSLSWTIPNLSNKPTITQTPINNTAKSNSNNAKNIAMWKTIVLGLGILALGILLGFLWCIRQYKRKWQELQKYMESKDEKLLQQNRDIKTLEKELQFFNQALYKGLQIPATDVKVNSNLLREKFNGSLDKEGTKYMTQIQKSANNLEGLLSAIFNFQQIKHYPLQLKEVNISRMAKTITAELKSRYPKREIRFWVQEDMIVQADEELVRLLLANLLHNALKFTQKNPIAIIEFGKKEHIFYVKDNGEGFNPQEAKVMFETFESLKHTKNFEQLTVSLLSMQTIVEKHAGTIWTVSQKEKGTTFFFTLDATPVKNEAKDFWNLSKSPHFKLML
ncbi:MAG: ATP-binding protein [Chitinophagales bacterium]